MHDVKVVSKKLGQPPLLIYCLNSLVKHGLKTLVINADDDSSPKQVVMSLCTALVMAYMFYAYVEADSRLNVNYLLKYTRG